jgi:hypothetical protein
VQSATEPAPDDDDGGASDGVGDGRLGDAAWLGVALASALADVEGEISGAVVEVEGAEVGAMDAVGADDAMHPPTSSAAPVRSGRKRDRAGRAVRGRPNRRRGTPRG